MKLPFKVACLQFNPELGRKQQNIERLFHLASQAAADGAKLIVTPEMATTGYHFADRQAIRDLAEPIPGPTTDRFGEICRKYGAYIVISLPETDLHSGLYYIAAAVIGPAGVIGTYRKMHLWETETRWAAPGNLGVPVFETELGRLAVNICMDSTFFESARMAALQGADLLAFPTNSSGQSLAVLKYRAEQNGLFIAAANRAGKEMDFHMIGGSAVWDPFGNKLAEGEIYAGDDPGARPLHDSIVYAFVDPSLYMNERKSLLLERRPELYHNLMLDLSAWDPVKEHPSRPVHAAVVQMTPAPGDKTSNLRNMEQLIKYVAEAAEHEGLDIIVFPELAFTGPPAGPGSACAGQMAASLDGEEVSRFRNLAARHRVHLVFGLLEAKDGHLYNSVILINPEGRIEGIYRKTHLTGEERQWASPGSEIAVCHSGRLGRVGLMTGYDANFPEAAGLMAIHRADLVIVPAAHPGAGHPPTMQAVAQSAQAYVLVSGYGEGSGLYGSDALEGLDQTEVMQPGDRVAYFRFQTRPAGRWFHQQALLAARRTLNYASLLEVHKAAGNLV